jgi:hypothetical protein
MTVHTNGTIRVQSGTLIGTYKYPESNPLYRGRVPITEDRVEQNKQKHDNTLAHT